jgi:hypothetical protein
MAFNGSGIFVRLYSWANDKAANIKVRADRMDNEMNGMATGLSTCITKDGQTTVTANLPMAGFRHTGVGNASARNHYATVGQIQDNSYVWVDGGGTADAITANYSPAVTALVDGIELKVRATAANTSTTPTFAPNGLTARTIVKQGAAALAANDIAGDGHELILRYNLANTRWELLNPSNPIGSGQIVTANIADGAVTTAKIADAAATAVKLASDSVTTIKILDGNVTNAKIANSAYNDLSTVTAASNDYVVIADTSDGGNKKKALVSDISVTLGTPFATTSGTAIDVTGIPAGTKRISINFKSVSTNGIDPWLIQLGDSGGVETTGYDSASTNTTSGGTGGNSSVAGFIVSTALASSGNSGTIILTLQNASTNTWCCNGALSRDGASVTIAMSGYKSTSGVLDRLRLTTTGGTNSFDAGEGNITYE